MSDRCDCTCGQIGCVSRRRSGQSPRRHGTKQRYIQEGCRCEPCTQAARLGWHQHKRNLALITEANATKHGQQWTGAELEQVLRTDITIREIALRLGRTYKAVEMARAKARHDPKWVAVVGMAS